MSSSKASSVSPSKSSLPKDKDKDDDDEYMDEGSVPPSNLLPQTNRDTPKVSDETTETETTPSNQPQIPTINYPPQSLDREPLRLPSQQAKSASNSSHSTISNTPTSSLSTSTTPRLSSKSVPGGKSLPPQNAVGRLKNTDPVPPPERLLQCNQKYPVLPPNKYLLDSNGRLKPAQERELVFEMLEARVVSLKAKCGEIVKAAKALQKACLASSTSNNNSNSTNGSSTNGVSSQYGGAGVSKKSSSKEKSSAGSAVGNTALKEKLRDELARLVEEGRVLRESIESESPVAVSMES
ncbi:hypothetical protein BCR33DRAFT_713713 [Rhizoclosmatium globosum]|uniref:Uncharacterized protein n=1 Tax=Rhizoclosmatium globosum TaxID=329046 RepID=A0A1Y2CQP4_9FUNG|nr:hypothetical protein BCR33DRAFT_713713 [Rhizoclosmatium globosum]|eukprot:ORY49358.1 hypothetical protein BCR33DRAFT_713713 [Rhizoclosmatium globosum]